jgi:hypothetical protein
VPSLAAFPGMLEADRRRNGFTVGQGRMAARHHAHGVPGAGGWRADPRLRDMGPDLQAVRVAADVRMTAALHIVRTTVSERDGYVLWSVAWQRDDGGNEIASVYGETTYQERIAPRLEEPWTREGDFRAP